MSRCPLGFALAYAVLASCLLVAPSSAQLSGASSEDSGGVLWTTKPVRVNPDRQALPRLPERAENEAYPKKIYVPQRVKVPDSATFILDGTTYRLIGVAPVQPHYICKEATGKRWSCGLRSRTTLRALIAGKQIACMTVERPDNDVVVVDCETSPGMTLARALLKNGAAVPVPAKGADFTEEVSHAMRTRAGIWSDVTFFTHNRAVADDQ